MSLHHLGTLVFAGGLRDLWPMLLLPLLAGLVSDRAAALLPRGRIAWIPAAVLAGLPGVIALVLLTPAALGFLGNAHGWQNFLLFRVTPLVAGALILRAAVRMILRQREVARLFAAGRAPGPRLAHAAGALGLRALELACPERECFVAGLVRPTVFVSAGALESLGDDELAAALHHERAHVRGMDTVVLFLLSVLADLAPFAGRGALSAYQNAREAVADREAAVHAGPLNLASALLALARPGPAPAAVLSMARMESLRWRMQALLEPPTAPTSGAPSWLGVAGGVGFNAALIAWPVAQLRLICMFWQG